MDSQTLSSKIASIKGIPEKTTLETMLLDKTYQIRFKKLDGDERKMTCTKQEKSIPQNRLPKNKSVPNKKTITVWDTNANDWRSFRYDRIIEVTELEV